MGEEKSERLNFPLWHIDMTDQELWNLLIKAACPICCNGYTDNAEAWHLDCIAKADEVMEILRPGWLKKRFGPSIATES